MSNSVACRTFIRHLLHVARTESEEQAIREARSELKMCRGDAWNRSAHGDMFEAASQLFEEMPLNLTFAFLVSASGSADRCDWVQSEFIKRVGGRTYQQFCFNHEDCRSDYKLSMACADRAYGCVRE